MVDSLLTGFILNCYNRAGADWGALYDEMCLAASRRIYSQLGYAELRQMGLGLDLDSLDSTAHLVMEALQGAGIQFSQTF